MNSLVWAHDSHLWGHPRPTLCRPWAQASELAEPRAWSWETRARAGGVGVKRARRARGLPLCGGAGAEPPVGGPVAPHVVVALEAGCRRSSLLDTYELTRPPRYRCVRRTA